MSSALFSVCVSSLSNFRQLNKVLCVPKHRTFFQGRMAKSNFEYVRFFEQEDQCLLNTWIIIRVDGKNFHRFSTDHSFKKPNDENALNLMSHAANEVVAAFWPDVVIAFGQSDEYSFAFRPITRVYNRRSSKLMSQVVSLFSSSYVMHWAEHMPGRQLQYPPVFDGRTVLYPTDTNLRDYFSWRQADCHVNNLYNTAFWTLIERSGLSRQEAELKLRGTMAADKHELLFSQFQLNYNDEPQMFRKGTVLIFGASAVKKKRRQQPKRVSLQQADPPAPADVEEVKSADVQPQPGPDHITILQRNKPVEQAESANGNENGGAGAKTAIAAPEATEGNGEAEEGSLQPKTNPQATSTREVLHLHCDIIGDLFWLENPNILNQGCKNSRRQRV